jgi:hypothetical protein
MSALAQVKATIPRDLKRRAFAVLALREEKFNGWLRRELEALLEETAKVERQGGEIPNVHELVQAAGVSHA